MVAGVIFLIVGIGMLVGGVLWGLKTQRFVSMAERADGVVTDLIESRDSDGSTYYPQVSFTTKDGRDVSFKSSVGGNPPPKRRGDKVAVLYEAADPEHAEINSFFALWLGPLLVGGVFGVLFPLIGLFSLLSGLRERTMKKRLRESGQRIAAEVQGVEGPAAGVAGWTILARATDPNGIQRIYRSAPLVRDPGAAMSGRKTIDIIVDPNDYGKYEVDLTFLQSMPDGSAMR